ncbi:Os03g0155566, partial [Oryza sativa Japonica Group]
LVAGECHAEAPPAGHDVVDVERLAAGGCDGEGERLADEPRVALPVGAPVPVQRDPPRASPLHRHRPHRPAPRHVRHQHQLEEVEPSHREPDPSLPPALHPTVEDGDDAGLVDADLEPGGLGHVEVRAGRVAPAAAVAGESPVGRAQVGGRDGHRGARPAPLRRRGGVAHDQVALPARPPVVEQHRAQRRRVRP